MKSTEEGGAGSSPPAAPRLLLFGYFYFINTYSYEIHCFYPTSQSVYLR